MQNTQKQKYTPQNKQTIDDIMGNESLSLKERNALRFQRMREKARVKRISIQEKKKETFNNKKEVLHQKKVEIKEKNIQAKQEHDWLTYSWRIITYPFKVLWMIICSIFNGIGYVLKNCAELVFVILEVIFAALS